MNSSISSFRGELRVLAVVLLTLVGTEVASRIAGRGVSTDEQHIRDIPNIALRLTSRTLPRVLFLGNSLTYCGVNPDVLQAELKDRGIFNASCELVVPDGTGLCDWYYLFKRHFRKTGREPNMVVFNFTGSALSDQGGISIGKLAQNTWRSRMSPNCSPRISRAWGTARTFSSAISLTPWENRTALSTASWPPPSLIIVMKPRN